MLRSHFGPIAIAAFFAVTAHSSVSHATIYTIDVGSYARSGLGDRLSSGFDIVNLGARTFSLDLTENVATTALLNPVTFTVGVNVPAATPAFTEFFTANRFITVNSGWSSLLSQFYSVTIATTDTIAFGASGNTSINMGARGIIDVAPQAMTISSAQIGTSTGNIFGTVTLRNFNKTWNGATSGSWSSGARWAQGFAPMSDQTATFASAGTYSVALDPAATAKNVTIGAGNVTFDAGATGSLAIVNELRVDGAAGTAANLRGTVSAGITYVGFNNAGQLNVQGGSFASADHIYLGRNGSGSIAQADGTVTVSNGNHLWLGFDTTGKGGYGLYGGMLNVTGSEFIGESGQGTFAQLAGTHVVGGSVRIGDANGSTGTMNVSGGTLVAGGMYVGGDLAASHGTGTLTVSDTADVTINGTTKLWNVASQINLAGGTLRTGSLDLGDRLFRFNWTGGTLLINGSGSNISTSFWVRNGRTLGGTGTLALTSSMSSIFVEPGGHLAPGDGLGVLHLGANVGLQNHSTLDIELAGTDDGQFDVLDVAGTVALAGDLTVATLNGFIPPIGQSWTILTNDGTDAIIGRFGNATETGLGYDLLTDGGFTYRIDYAGGTGNDIVVTAVPEPSSIGLFIIAATGMLARRRRRRRQRSRDTGTIHLLESEAIQ